MMNKLFFLVLAFAIAAPALADDFSPAYFRGWEGSTYSEWTYDDPCGVGEWDGPDNSYFVSHPEKEDPYQDPCSPGGAWFSNQSWVGNDDPCLPAWENLLLPAGDRTGGLYYQWGSWDLNNFIHDQPAKDMWIQMTYYNMDNPGVPATVEYDPCYGETYVGGGYWVEDPCTPEEEWGWAYDDDGDYEMPLSEWDAPLEPMYTWWAGGGYEEIVQAELVSTDILPDGWIQQVFACTFDMNPEGEYFYVSFEEIVQLDQIIIETLCYVPEPASMVLLGLGSLMMIRRKKR